MTGILGIDNALFDVGSLAAARTHYSALGLVEPFRLRTGWAAEYADPWGNVVGFTDYTREPAFARPETTR
jgi:hypothetical protein